MTDETRIDRSHAAMQAAPDAEDPRLAFYADVAASELFLLLADAPSSGDETVTPELFDLDGTRYALVFDREERLAQFVGGVASYVALSGRGVASMLAEQGIGLGLNLDVAPSSILLPPDAVDWLNATLAQAPREVQAGIAELRPPDDLPERFVTALDARLAAAAGRADRAYLALAIYRDGTRGHLLAFVGALQDAETALAQAGAEAMAFSGLEAGAIDIAFVCAGEPMVDRLDRVGLRFDLPAPQAPAVRPAPGSDPARPPKLR